MMRRVAIIFWALSLLAGSPALASVVETSAFFSPRTPEQLAGQFAQKIPENMSVRPAADGYLVNYNGTATPEYLVEFLGANIPSIDVDLFNPGRSVSLSLAVTPHNTGSKVRLMVLSNNPKEPNSPFPNGSEVIYQDGLTQNCRGQIVIAQDQLQTVSRDIYSNWAKAQGFHLTAVTDATGSFFIGQRDGCAIFMNIESDAEAPESSLVVVSYLEE